nr:MAG TPA: JAB Prokaryotic homologs of the JAB domain [Caudoviricetes sp.]
MIIFFAIVLLLYFTVFISIFLRIEIDYHSHPMGGASHTAGPICTPPILETLLPKI